MHKIGISCFFIFLVLATKAQDTTLNIDNGSFTLTDAIVRIILIIKLFYKELKKIRVSIKLLKL